MPDPGNPVAIIQHVTQGVRWGGPVPRAAKAKKVGEDSILPPRARKRDRETTCPIWAPQVQYQAR